MSLRFDGFYCDTGASFAVRFYNNGVVVGEELETPVSLVVTPGGSGSSVSNNSIREASSVLNTSAASWIGRYSSSGEGVVFVMDNKYNRNRIRFEGSFFSGYLMGSSESQQLSSLPSGLQLEFVACRF